MLNYQRVNMILTMKNCRFKQPKIRSSLTNTASIMTSITLCFPRPAGPCSSCSPSGFAGASFGFLRRQNHGIAWEKSVGKANSSRNNGWEGISQDCLEKEWTSSRKNRENVWEILWNGGEGFVGKHEIWWAETIKNIGVFRCPEQQWGRRVREEWVYNGDRKEIRRK